MGEEVIEMAVLVTYASKHGATQEIAERIAQTLAAAGKQAQVRPVSAAGDLAPVAARREEDRTVESENLR